MMPVELNAVHLQRIGGAVEASRRVAVVFELDGDTDTAQLVWRGPDRRVRHVIASGSEFGMRRMLPVVQAEFARQVAELEGSAARAG